MPAMWGLRKRGGSEGVRDREETRGSRKAPPWMYLVVEGVLVGCGNGYGEGREGGWYTR